MNLKLKVILSVAFPILVMAGWITKLTYDRTTGLEIELPIVGYDPRDLLSGHYLQFQVVYGELGGCPRAERSVGRHWGAPVCQCVRSGEPVVYWSGFCSERPEDCDHFIKGNCRYMTQFIAGIERFYISEKMSQARFIPSPQARVKLSVPRNGRALVTGLTP